MKVVLGSLFLVGLLAGCIWIAVSAVRAGMKARFFFSYRLLEGPFMMATIVLVIGPVFDWFQGEEIIWADRIWTLAILCTVGALLYTFGFLLGLRKRSRNEGIVSLGDY